MQRFHEFRARLYVCGLVIALASCASWQANTKKLGDVTYEAVRAATRTADSMVAAGKMTPQQRQSFAKEISVPTLTILDEAITATLQWKEGEPIPENVSRLIGVLAKAVDSIAKTFGENTQLHSDLIKAKNAASEFLEEMQ